MILKEYNADYPLIFEKEVELLKETIHRGNTKYHHIGRTAIPYIFSKPVVDIAIELDGALLNKQDIERVTELGYKFGDSNPNPHHQFFFKNLPRTDHLHFYPKGY